MTELAAESTLLIEHWRTVEEIIAAMERLDGELAAWLNSLESRFAALDWWSEEWAFRRYTSPQIYISNEAWLQGNRYAIWIGIESFNSKSLFGSSSASQLYLWVNNRSPELLGALVDRLKDLEPDLPGEIDTRLTNSYAARQAATKYLDGDVGAYLSTLQDQIVDFFSFYAQWLWDIDNVIQQHL